MKSAFLTLGMILLTTTTMAAPTGRELLYRAGDSTLIGYIAHNGGPEIKQPGILVVHEWWGLNDYARKRARMLAELGYTAMAVDMYGDGKTAGHPEDAARFSGELRKNLPLAQERFLAALDVLKRQPDVDPNRIAAIGYCFGGGVVLEMARSGVDLDGVVSFHGNLATDHPAKQGKVKARILVLNGAEDTFVTREQIAAFKQEMEAAGASWRFVDYPGAKHSFTNPQADEYGRKFNLPLAYDPKADAQSWQEMQDFFTQIFSPNQPSGERYEFKR